MSEIVWLKASSTFITDKSSYKWSWNLRMNYEGGGFVRPKNFSTHLKKNMSGIFTLLRVD